MKASIRSLRASTAGEGLKSTPENYNYRATGSYSSRFLPISTPMEANGNRATRIVVVDDSEVVRATLREMFANDEAAAGFELVGEAADGEEGLVVAKREQPDVVVMDLKMPGISGIEATWKLG